MGLIEMQNRAYGSRFEAMLRGGLVYDADRFKEKKHLDETIVGRIARRVYDDLIDANEFGKAMSVAAKFLEQEHVEKASILMLRNNARLLREEARDHVEEAGRKITFARAYDQSADALEGKNGAVDRVQRVEPMKGDLTNALRKERHVEWFGVWEKAMEEGHPLKARHACKMGSLGEDCFYQSNLLLFEVEHRLGNERYAEEIRTLYHLKDEDVEKIKAKVLDQNGKKTA